MRGLARFVGLVGVSGRVWEGVCRPPVECAPGECAWRTCHSECGLVGEAGLVKEVRPGVRRLAGPVGFGGGLWGCSSLRHCGGNLEAGEPGLVG